MPTLPRDYSVKCLTVRHARKNLFVQRSAARQRAGQQLRIARQFQRKIYKIDLELRVASRSARKEVEMSRHVHYDLELQNINYSIHQSTSTAICNVYHYSTVPSTSMVRTFLTAIYTRYQHDDYQHGKTSFPIAGSFDIP